jgi:uncharacterized protein YigE (DUF2233 family)
MNKSRFIFLTILLCLFTAFFSFRNQERADELILSYTVDPARQDIQFYWKDDKGNILGSIQKLKNYIESKHKTLLFATNGGMYTRTQAPQGLFIQHNKILASLDTSVGGNGNFYLKPNGVFYLTDNNKAVVCKTTDFKYNAQIKYATQSGPMLVVDGAIHPAFKEGSSNLNIRNGIGILPDNKIVFAMSKKEINFYDFALYFKKLGCNNALYLDGFVSKTYLPEKNWIQTDGNFGVMIGVTEKSDYR